MESKPRTDKFVVIGLAEDAVSRAASAAEGLRYDGTVGHDPRLAVLDLEDGGGDAHAGWARVAQAVGQGATVVPVLRAADGSLQYPTGVIQVRFHEPPDDETLARFAAHHGLVLRGRNRWQERQAAFAASSPGTFLPDLVTALGEQADVRAAWLDCYVAYHRAD